MPIDEQENNDLASQSTNTQQLVGPLWQVQSLCCLGRAVLRRSFADTFFVPIDPFAGIAVDLTLPTLTNAQEKRRYESIILEECKQLPRGALIRLPRLFIFLHF